MSLGIGLSNKILYIVDIRFKQKDLDLYHHISDKASNILSLTPYSNYLLEELKLNYQTIDDIIPAKEFNDNIFREYKKIASLVQKYNSFSYMLYHLIFLRTKQMYYFELFNYLTKLVKYNIVYITDTKPISDMKHHYNFMSNEVSLLHSFSSVDKIILIDKKDKQFYRGKKLRILFFKLKNTKYIFKKVLNHFLKSKKTTLLSYDNINIGPFFTTKKELDLELDLLKLKKEYLEFKSLFLNLYANELLGQTSNIYDRYFLSFETLLENISQKESSKVLPFVFLSNSSDFLRLLRYKENNIQTFFTQHGSYVHENLTLKHCEIYPADINFVFNEYTKKLFEKRGASKVEVVGSVNFNKPYRDLEKVYDFVYIAFCSSYVYTGSFSGMESSELSPDGKKIYERHIKVIKMFGRLFKNKKLCIKVQPSVMSSSMYIPFLELVQNYSNITVEYIKPLHELIEESRYVISDYFSSEFTNREIHYKKDIILFYGLPYMMEDSIIEDMEQMFLLCKDEDVLETIVNQIEILSKNRVRNDDIIEYYSSKKCDTTKLMNQVLNREYNGG